MTGTSQSLTPPYASEASARMALVGYDGTRSEGTARRRMTGQQCPFAQVAGEGSVPTWVTVSAEGIRIHRIG